MIISVVLFGFESADGAKFSHAPVTAGADKQLILKKLEISPKMKVFYSFSAIIVGLCIPLTYTFKAYAIRKYCTNYKSWDVGIDSLICEHLCYCCMYICYLTYTPWNWKEFWYGQLVGILYLYGKQSLTMAYAEGPGGPVNTIVIT